MSAQIKTAFDAKKVVKGLIATLPERSHDVIVMRFGLGKNTKRCTLDAIGKEYGITRERVRQIENHALASIRQSKEMEKEQKVFIELRGIVEDLGCLVAEEDLLAAISDDASIQNHIHFLLVLGEFFVQQKESDDFRQRWYTDEEVAHSVERALKNLYGSLEDDEILPEGELVARLLDELKDLNEKYRREEVLKRWLTLFKRIDCNPLGEWGSVNSTSIRGKGIRDFAYLSMKRHGSPMHFTEVADAISELFGRRAHTATCHNELIKDERFVLVGRGLYALKEWGYKTGVVRDVIRDILEKEGPLTRQEIIDLVKKERYVKDNTILVNLNDRSLFKRHADGTYTPVQ